MKELGPPTPENIRRISDELLVMLRECAARYDVDKLPLDELPPVIELLIEAQQLDVVKRALARALADPGIAPAQRGNFLALAVQATLAEPRSEQRLAAAEGYVAQLDALGPPALEPQLAAHGALNGDYRFDDLDAGMTRHSTWLIDTGATLSPELRKKHGSTVVTAYATLAEVLVGQGHSDRAIELLNRATKEWPDAEGRRIDGLLARAVTIGRPAPALSAPVWLNRAGGGPLPVEGKVTLVQFGAHWCGPCKQTYPAMNRLLQRFAKDGLQAVFYTRTYGYFGSDRDLTREQEIERDKIYFAENGVTLPVAIGAPAGSEDAVLKAYAVNGIPQFNIIDKKGRNRLFIIGYGGASEQKMEAFIKMLLSEK